MDLYRYMNGVVVELAREPEIILSRNKPWHGHLNMFDNASEILSELLFGNINVPYGRK